MATGDTLLQGINRNTMANMPDGTSGQVLTAQGAGIDPVYAAGGGLDIGDSDWDVIDDFTNWSQSVAGGTTLRAIHDSYVNTGTVAAQYASIYYDHYKQNALVTNFGKPIELFFMLGAQFTIAAGKAYLKLDDANDVADPTTRAMGFRLDGQAVKGIAHDGTTLTVTDLAVSIASAPHRLHLKFTPIVKIEFYVDGILKGTQAVDLPSGNLTAGRISMGASLTSGITAYILEMYRYAYKFGW